MGNSSPPFRVEHNMAKPLSNNSANMYRQATLDEEEVPQIRQRQSGKFHDYANHNALWFVKLFYETYRCNNNCVTTKDFTIYVSRTFRLEVNKAKPLCNNYANTYRVVTLHKEEVRQIRHRQSGKLDD
jgi:hypothetical protein